MTYTVRNADIGRFDALCVRRSMLPPPTQSEICNDERIRYFIFTIKPEKNVKLKPQFLVKLLTLQAIELDHIDITANLIWRRSATNSSKITSPI